MLKHEIRLMVPGSYFYFAMAANKTANDKVLKMAAWQMLIVCRLESIRQNGNNVCKEPYGTHCCCFFLDRYG